MIRFEWDAEKAKRNAIKHGVTFEEASGFLNDLGRTEIIDDRFEYGEVRLATTASVGGRFLTIVFVDHDSCIRLISARLATKREIDDRLQAAY
jgi:uncharacterized protein